MSSTVPEPPISFPRQEAVTRRFRLGLPRSFSLAPDGIRVAFLRSAGGRDPVGSLWVADAVDGDLVERLVVDGRDLVRAETDLPPAEKARRERMRETTTGITAFSADAAVTRAAFSIDGTPFAVDLSGPDHGARELRHPGPVVDPQMSPDGRWVAYVCERSLHLTPSDGVGESVPLCVAESDTQSWGLADFVAAEELDRVRGHWWLADSTAVLVEHVDEAAVEIRWISDPSRPEVAPTPHRYPASGTANPQARLFRVCVDGSRTEIEWDHENFPYLSTVQVDEEGGAVISLLSRDQRRQRVLGLEPGSGAATVLRERVTAPWTTVCHGVPCRAPDGALVEVVVNDQDDCFQLLVDGRPLTPPGTQVTGVAHASTDRIIVTAQSDPMQQHVVSVDRSGRLEPLTSGPSVNAVVAGSGGAVIVTSDSDSTGPRFLATLTSASGAIRSLAETPVVTPEVAFHRVGERALAAAVLWPRGHVPGSGPVPVIVSPYGGPHHARVVHSSSSFAADQWLADQGFAVVVVDGRGTPGRGPAWEFAISHDLAAVVLDDQVAALTALAALYPDLDMGRVGITGWSFGGYLAALAVLDRPDVFHAAVAGAPVTEWRLYDTAYTERYLGTPQEHPDAYDAASLLPRAARLERPLLIIHGLADDNVLVANTFQLSGALLAAGKAHSVLPLSGVTHMTPQEVVAENLLRLEVAFFAEHLA